MTLFFPNPATYQACDWLRKQQAVAAKTSYTAATKTGCLLTNKNMEFLTKAEIKEWKDAYREYDRLATSENGKH